MRRAPVVLPRECQPTLCPRLWREYVEEQMSGGSLDPLAIAVMALSRAFRTHVVTVTPSGVDATTCSDGDAEVRDAVGGVVRGYRDLQDRYLECMRAAHTEATNQREAVRRARRCLGSFVESLAEFSGDRASAEALGRAFENDVAFIAKAVRGPVRADKAERLASRTLAEAGPALVGLLTHALARALLGWSLITVRWLGGAVVVAVEDGGGKRLYFSADAGPHAFFTALSDAWPGVFRLGCSCEHAELARVVRQSRDPMVWRLVAHYALRHMPQLAEEVPKSIRTEEDALWAVTAAHSAEVGYASAVDWVGGAPLCVSLLTCPVRGIEELIEIRK